MRKPVIVDTPYPTVWETAKKMGVSKKRTLELIKMADETHARMERARQACRAVTQKKQLKTA
ncbi:MAG: hypothetical protein ABSF22_00870 [Bryobacteraceae bacterium]|jgi:hypothetical protein